MRTKNAQAAAIINSASHSGRMVVSIADASDVLQVLGTIGADPQGWTPVLEVDVKEDVDSFMTATIRVMRTRGRWNFSTFLTGPGNPLQPTIGQPRIACGRRVLIEGIVTPSGSPQAELTGARIKIFEGYVDEVNEPGDALELTCTDKSALPRDTYIEDERVYGYATGANATKGCIAWRSDLRPLVVGELVIPSEAKMNGHFYRVTTAGTVGITEPTWPTGGGATVGSGTCVFTEVGTATIGSHTSVQTIMQQILNDNMGGSAPTLYCPVSPGWNILSYSQARQPVIEALRTFAEQLGWCLRYIWNNATSAFELTLFAPDRARVTVDKTIEAHHVSKWNDLKLNVWDVRNVIRVIYGDRAVLTPSGEPARKVKEVSDNASILKWKRRFMEVAESSASQIDSDAEATQYANAMLSDLKDPLAVAGPVTLFDPFIELGDLCRVMPDGVRFSAYEDLAIVAYNHTATEAGVTTSITVQGKPVAYLKTWGERENRPGGSLNWNPTQGMGSFPIDSSIVGGVMSVMQPQVAGDVARRVEHEVHVSRTPNFTPSKNTLRGDALNVSAADLVPNRDYFVKRVPYRQVGFGKRVARGEPGPEVTVRAGRASAGHLDSKIILPGPPNGNFEVLNDFDPFDADKVRVSPPDLWRMQSGTWGPAGDVYWGTAASTVGNFLSFRQKGTTGVVETEIFPIEPGAARFGVTAYVRPIGTLSAGRDLQVHVDFYTDPNGNNPVGTGDLLVPYNIVAANNWALYRGSIDASVITGVALYAKVSIFKPTISSAYGFDVANIRLLPFVDVPQMDWVAPTLQNSFTNYNAATHPAAGYFKDSNGMVHLRGLLARATAATLTAVFNLPAGFRPNRELNFIATANATWVTVRVSTNGNVDVSQAGAADWRTFFSLNGISFDTRA